MMLQKQLLQFHVVFPHVDRTFQQTFLCACLFLTSVCLSERCRRCWPTMKTSVQGWVLWWKALQTIQNSANSYQFSQWMNIQWKMSPTVSF